MRFLDRLGMTKWGLEAGGKWQSLTFVLPEGTQLDSTMPIPARSLSDELIDVSLAVCSATFRLALFAALWLLFSSLMGF